MNIGNLKSMLAAVAAAVGMTAAAEPTVTVGEVKTGEPWSKVTVNYTLGGTDAATDYKVAFDVTAAGQTASVTNDAAKLADGATNAVIDTVALFGRQVTDTRAKVRVTLIAVKPEDLGGVQLWAGGPFWAEANVGATLPGDYGDLYDFAAAPASVSAPWHVPSATDFTNLLANCDVGYEYCTDSNGADVKGCRFTSKSDPSKSIFLPMAGIEIGGVRRDAGNFGNYWSSTESEYDGKAMYLTLQDKSKFRVETLQYTYPVSVRAVRSAQ